jgi:hypothetical protein
MKSLAPLKPERSALSALQYNTVVILVRKRAHSSGHCDSFRPCGWPLRPYSRLISRDGQRFCRIAVLYCPCVLDQRKNCPLDAPQTSAHNGSRCCHERCLCQRWLASALGGIRLYPSHQLRQLGGAMHRGFVGADRWKRLSRVRTRMRTTSIPAQIVRTSIEDMGETSPHAHKNLGPPVRRPEL